MNRVVLNAICNRRNSIEVVLEEIQKFLMHGNFGNYLKIPDIRNVAYFCLMHILIILKK